MRRLVISGFNWSSFFEGQAWTVIATLGIENCGQEGQNGRKADDGKRNQFLFINFQSFLLNHDYLAKSFFEPFCEAGDGFPPPPSGVNPLGSTPTP